MHVFNRNITEHWLKQRCIWKLMLILSCSHSLFLRERLLLMGNHNFSLKKKQYFICTYETVEPNMQSFRSGFNLCNKMMTVDNLFIFNLGWQSKNFVFLQSPVCWICNKVSKVFCVWIVYPKNIFSVECAKFIFFSCWLIIVSKILQPVGMY